MVLLLPWVYRDVFLILLKLAALPCLVGMPALPSGYPSERCRTPRGWLPGSAQRSRSPPAGNVAQTKERKASSVSEQHGKALIFDRQRSFDRRPGPVVRYRRNVNLDDGKKRCLHWHRCCFASSAWPRGYNLDYRRVLRQRVSQEPVSARLDWLYL